MNPARSLGPALVAWTWSGHWLYWAGPLMGASGGAVFYRWLRGGQHSATADAEPGRPYSAVTTGAASGKG